MMMNRMRMLMVVVRRQRCLSAGLTSSTAATASTPYSQNAFQIPRQHVWRQMPRWSYAPSASTVRPRAAAAAQTMSISTAAPSISGSHPVVHRTGLLPSGKQQQHGNRLYSIGQRRFSSFRSVGPPPPQFPWVGAMIIVGVSALAVFILFFIGKFILIGFLMLGGILLLMKGTRSSSMGRQLSRRVGINPDSLTGRQILSSIVDSAMIEKLNESAALQRKVGPVLVTEFELDHGNDDESTFSVEGEVRNMNGKVVGWMYARSDVREVALTPRKGLKERLSALFRNMNRPSIDEDKEETIGDALSRAAEAVPEYLYDLNQLEVHILSPTDPEETAEIIDLTTEAAGEYQAVEFAPDWESIKNDIPDEFLDTFRKFYKSRQEYRTRESKRDAENETKSPGPTIIDVEYREKRKGN